MMGKILETTSTYSTFFAFLTCIFVYLLYYVCTAVLTLYAGLLARSQYPEGPATGHLDTVPPPPLSISEC